MHAVYLARCLRPGPVGALRTGATSSTLVAASSRALRPSMTRRATSDTTRLRLAAPALVAVVAVALGACGGPAAAPTSTTYRPPVGPEAGVTSHYGGTVGRPGEPTTVAAEAATRAYAAQVQGGAAAFVASVGALQADIARGDTATARSDELAAQSDYDGFRDLERGNSVNADSLDELDTDVPAGQTFGGLHAVERDLWTSGPAAGDAASLGAQAPVAQFLLSHLRLGPEAIGVVAVDQLDWAVDQALPSSQEHTSHLGLVDVAATVGAARQAFATVAPLARLVAPGLTATVTSDFATLDAAVAALGPPTTTLDTAVPADLRLAAARQLDATATALARLTATLAPYGTQGAPS